MEALFAQFDYVSLVLGLFIPSHIHDLFHCLISLKAAPGVTNGLSVLMLSACTHSLQQAKTRFV